MKKLFKLITAIFSGWAEMYSKAEQEHLQRKRNCSCKGHKHD